jgi:hypothetical protein
MDFETRQALIARVMERARRDRAEAAAALLTRAAKALWTQVRKLQRAWVALRTRTAQRSHAHGR